MKLFDVYPLYPIELSKASGSKVWDKNGQEYIDLYGGHAVISIGHSHPYYVQKITEQLQQIGFYSNSVIISGQEELAEKVSENIAITFRQNFGGIPIYIHKSEDHSVRNAEIYRKFNGRNTHELCREYSLCYQQICKIIKNERSQRKSH